MVVLEEGGMLTTGHNQYLQPDYLSPLPTTLDAKKSPLALLAQTCSQIGADSSTKPLISPLDKLSKGNSSSNARSPPEAKFERTRSSPSEPKALGFKPYETNVLTKKSGDDGRPASKASVHSVGGGDSASVCENNNNNDRKSGFSPGNGTPVGRKSASPSHPTGNSERRTPAETRDKTQSPQANNNNKTTNSNHSNQSSSSSGASPIIRSGMEILSGHPKDNPMGAYKHSAGFTSFANNPLCCPPGLSENPAFRPSFAGASPFSHHHVAAAALLGYPTATPSTGNPYLSYARVKTPNGAEALVPVCKDPYCTGCQYSMHNAQMVMGAGSCPSSCTQCDHQKYGLAMALSSLGPMPPPSLSYPSALSGGRPYVCNWVSGESYCGKRCGTSEELLQHLRSHTSFGTPGNGSATDPATTSTLVNTQHHPLLSPSAALHRVAANGAYPAPSLSPLGARYHPYSKPPTGPLPASLAASPYSAFNALSPYYSPYAIYSQRIGAAVHP